MPDSDREGEPAPVTETKKYVGMMLIGDVVHLYETAEGMRLAWPKPGDEWSSITWISAVVFHAADETQAPKGPTS